MTEPKTAAPTDTKTRATAPKPPLPDAMQNPGEMVQIRPVIGDALRAVVKHYRETGQDESRRYQVIGLRRLLAQVVTYAGEPTPVDDLFGEIDGL